ncbi:MAG: DUF4062 domain-containing protein [Ignavibacteriales bacterium]|nr:DUF4062 domain-containing protein [Ignavibacteriales bacterium]
MKSQLPKIFISSTFYDLRQIRADISNFIENELGYQFLRSEHPSFPVNPDADTIENCKQQVENCDILIIVVGGRYGNIPNGEHKSVTNLEYLTAKSKNKPIYVFIVNSILSIYPVWQNNPTSDYSSVVDNPNIFEFISDIKKDSKWIFPFETAQDIITALRLQFAYLFYRGIELIKKVGKDSSDLDPLVGESFRLAVEKPDGWAGLLFAELLKQEIKKRVEVKLAYSHKINIGNGEIIRDEDAITWLTSINNEGRRFIVGLNIIINEALSEAFTNKDVQKINSSAKIIGSAYEEALKWSLKIRKAFINKRYKQLLEEMSLMLDDSIIQLEILSDKIESAVQEALTNITSETITVKLEVVLKIANELEVYNQIERLKDYQD